MENIIKALMEEEAKDYTPVKSAEWVEKASKILIGIINALDSSVYSYVEITNRFGVDSHSRSLRLLLPQAKADNLKISNISICDCGRLNHLFRIIEDYNG